MRMPYTDSDLERWITLVSEEFYRTVYEDPWLKQVFLVPQEHIRSQQVDFVVAALGGPKRYSGRNPGDAHTHIFINEEMWALREELLDLAFKEVDCPEDIRAQWLKIERAFKKEIVMNDVGTCKKRFLSDEIIVVPRPIRNAS